LQDGVVRGCVSIWENRIDEDSALEVDALEVGALEVGAPEVGVSEVGVPEVGVPEVGFLEVGALEDDALEDHSWKLTLRRRSTCKKLLDGPSAHHHGAERKLLEAAFLSKTLDTFLDTQTSPGTDLAVRECPAGFLVELPSVQ